MHITEALGGGIQSYLKDVINHQLERGLSIYLIHTLRNTDVGNDEYDNLYGLGENRIVVDGVTNVSLYQDLKTAIQIFLLIKKIKPDVVHLHSSKMGAIGRIIRPVLSKSIRFFYTPHGFSFYKLDIGPAARKIYYLIESLLSIVNCKVICCSNSEYESTKGFFGKKNILIIPNGVSVKDVLPYKKEFTANKSKLIVVTSGRLSYQKNPQMFINVAKKLNNIIDINFVWIGGEINDKTEYVFDFLNSNIRKTGWLSREKSLEVLSSADIYIHTALWEGMPLTLIEAQLLGLPSVVLDAVGSRDVIKDEETGYIVEDEDHMCRKIIELAHSNAKRETMGKAASVRAIKFFDMKNHETKLMEKYLVNAY